MKILFVLACLFLGTFAQSNLFTSDVVTVLEISGYDTSVGFNTALPDLPWDLSLPGDLTAACDQEWEPTGTFCADELVDDPDVSVTATADIGATWNNFHDAPYYDYFYDGTLVGTLVFDAGSDITITDLSVFQMFSDGKATGFEFSVLTGGGAPTGAQFELYQDPNWSVVVPFSPLGPGFYTPYVYDYDDYDYSFFNYYSSQPDYFSFPAVTGRYFRFAVTNDGTYGDETYTELRTVKAYNLGGVGGDPHIFGLDGSEFELHGTSGDVFNILTSSELQVNIELIDFKAAKPLYDSFVGALAFLTSSGNSIVFSFVEGVAMADFNGEAVPVADIASLSFEDFTVRQNAHPRALSEQQKWHNVVHSLLVEFPTFSFHINFADNKVFDGSRAQFLDFEMGTNSQEAAANAHGLVGRTASQHSARASEGSVQDFQVTDGLLGTSFAFNRFGL